MSVETLVPSDALYERDFYLWTQAQAAALRAAGTAGANVPVDWENVAEEIESLGRSDVRALRSHLKIIIEHLLKLETSPAVAPRQGWVETVLRARDDFAGLLAESPSLKPRVDGWIAEEHRLASRRALTALERHGELSAEITARLEAQRFGRDEVLGDWLPATRGE